MRSESYIAYKKPYLVGQVGLQTGGYVTLDYPRTTLDMEPLRHLAILAIRYRLLRPSL